MLRRLAVAFVLFACQADLSLASDSTDLRFARVDVHEIGHANLQDLRKTPGVANWIELDKLLLIEATPAAIGAIQKIARVEPLSTDVRKDRLRILRHAHPEDAGEREFRVLASGGRFAVIELTGSPEASWEFPDLLPLGQNLVLAHQRANSPTSSHRQPPLAISSLVDQVDSARWFLDVESLASFNRYTHGSDIHNARDWIEARFESIPGLRVEAQSFSVNGTPAFNVVATRPGKVTDGRWILVGAHYDAISEIPASSAPGAEDNASGCAGVLEIARVLARTSFDEQIVFLCYSGEEQGLHGSRDHAARLVDSGDDEKIVAMLNMDMIGYTGDPDLDCLLETSPDFAYLNEIFAEAASRVTNLRIVVSLFAFGSDHVPYLDQDIPALLTIENDWDSYPNYHRSTDLPGSISQAMGEEILRMNVAALVALSSGRLFSDGFETGDLGAWSETFP